MEKMNIDIVTSGDEDDQVNYGEPSPEAVYRAAFGVEPDIDANLLLIKSIVEEIEEVYWEIFSIEFGCEQQSVSFWRSIDDIRELSNRELHDAYEEGMAIVQSEYSRHYMMAVVNQ